MKVSDASYSRETGVLTRFAAKNKSELVKPLEVEVQSSSDEIHVTESKANILREDGIIIPSVIVKKRRRLVFCDSSSSSSGHSTPTP